MAQRQGKLVPSSTMSVAKLTLGGHNIPVADIERRFARSLRNLLNAFSPAVDGCRCFMNNTSEPTLVFEQKAAQRIVAHPVFFELLMKESQP